MIEKFNNLLSSFDKALENKEKDKFGKEDVEKIFSAASELFDGAVNLDDKQIGQIRDRWVKLAEGRINNAGAMKKLQGTSRAQAIQSVLNSIV